LLKWRCKWYGNLGYEREQEELTDRIEVHYIELKKFLKRNPGISSKLEQWLWLLIGEEEKVKMASKKNKTIEKVVKDLDEMSSDENERLEAYKRKLAVWDYNMNIMEATKRGKEEGIVEGKAEIAKKLREKGLSTKEIEEITGLTKKEIEEVFSSKEE
jgi:predicted transposase/invertase (TIGR01784 family)